LDKHNLSETKLSRSLDAVVEDCVTGIGPNPASHQRRVR
jgi:transcriptional accessory protein Tex/SPT6